MFLSGNGPLVAVLQEALTRDEYSPRRAAPCARVPSVSRSSRSSRTSITFGTTGFAIPAPPFDHVVIFDEAQRAWNREKTADFMKRRKGAPASASRSRSS